MELFLFLKTKLQKNRKLEKNHEKLLLIGIVLCS